jgi:hypothetical protein
MTYELTNLEKIGVIDQSLKEIEFNIYINQINIISAQADPSNTLQDLEPYNAILTSLSLQKSALLAEKAKVNDID